jgi:enoyl-CoA hydratase/carnithine racemase
MPTVCWINGHAFGAGVFVAVAHDYRIMNGSKGFYCLPEADMSFPIPATLATLFREKVSSNVYRDAVFEAARYTGPQALERGLVDGLGGLEETIKLIDSKKLVEKSQKGVIGHLKHDAYRNIIIAFDDFDGHTQWQNDKFSEEEDSRVARKSKL